MKNQLKEEAQKSPQKVYSEAFKRQVVREYERAFLTKASFNASISLVAMTVFWNGVENMVNLPIHHQEQ